MSKKVFLSFNYVEKEWRENLRQMFQAWTGSAQATPVTLEANEVLDPSDSRIREAIRDKLSRCHGLLLLIGNQAQQSRWIDHELQVASSAGIRCAGTRHPQAS